tara:strand:+ start:596 stop:2746 length:2151 start_codon:yes stop_codon:yes gene_type:complete
MTAQSIAPRNLSFVSVAVSKALQLNDVNEEVNYLLEEARNTIGRFEATDEWLANNLAELPEVVEGNVIIMYKDERDFNQIKLQSLSDSLWVIVMKQVQYHLAVNYDLLSTAFANWINDNVYTEHEDLGRKEYSHVTVETTDMVGIAKDYLAAMQSLNIIVKNLSKKVVRLQAGNNITSKVYEISPEFTAQLNTHIEELRERAVYKCRPMTHMPQDWTDMNTGVGENANMKLVARAKVKSVKVSDLVLSAVNKLQRVKFTVSPWIVEAAKDMVMNKSLYTQQEYKDRFFSDKEVSNEAFDIYNEIQQYAGKEFYFPVTMDTRGRMYYRGGLLSPQGVDFCKAAFQFANSKPLGKHGFKAVCLHIANSCGMGAEAINNRVRWVQDNWETIMSINTHQDVRKNFVGADVFQALVACKELSRLAKITGSWDEKSSNLVCHMDGTCNGLQHMAAITGDRATAEAVNCVESTYDQVPADVYGLVSSASEKHVVGNPLELIQKYGRGMSKNYVMITSYGATETTTKANIAKYLTSKRENVTSSEDISDAYLEAITETAGAITQLTDAIKTRVQFALAAGMKKFVWRTADDFLASTRYDDDESMAVRVGLFYTRKRGMGSAPLDARKTAQAMTPNFVHSIDATHLRLVVNACDHELVTVHDSIGSHPCDYFATASMVRQKFAMVHTGYDALTDLCESMKQPVPVFPRTGDYSATEALKSAYIFS